MIMEINWSLRAESDFDKILAYLNENWGVKEVTIFIDQTESILENISKNPKMFIESPNKTECTKRAYHEAK